MTLNRAPRQPLRWLRQWARGVLRALILWLASLGAATACDAPSGDAVAGSVVQSGAYTAWYEDLTDRYAHGVLGDALEPQTLAVAGPGIDCATQIVLARSHVFEDLAPRFVDLTADGIPEIITIRSHANKGAQIAIYGVEARGLKLIAQTPYIGTRNRWLAPVAWTDLDGDGAIEIAFIDRPHLAKRLRIWRFTDGELRHVIDQAGLTNHRIGEDFISGGLRDCGDGPEMILADAGWRSIMAVRFDGSAVTSRRLGRFAGRASMENALACPD